MRGFKNTKQPSQPALGEKAYNAFITGQRAENNKTENARRWYKMPAYCIGERRKDYERSIRGND